MESSNILLNGYKSIFGPKGFKHEAIIVKTKTILKVLICFLFNLNVFHLLGLNLKILTKISHIKMPMMNK